jgi:hypothetical protein
LFEIRLNFPTIASNGTAETSRLRFLAQSATLPGMNIGQVEVPYFGRTIKLEGNPTYDDWTFEVLNDEDFTIRAAFEAWVNGMNAIVSNRKDPSFKGLKYKSNATVYQLSKELDSDNVESAIKAYTFSGIFPKVIAPIRLDWSATNSVETFGVTLACDYWVPGADENYTNHSGYNGVDGSAKVWSPVLASDTNK